MQKLERVKFSTSFLSCKFLFILRFSMSNPMSNQGPSMQANPNQQVQGAYQAQTRIAPAPQTAGTISTVQTQQQPPTQPPPGPPILGHLDGLIKTITDSNQRDDLKLKALQVK